LWLSYRVAVKDSYCITFARDDSMIDLYVHLSLGGVIFIDGGKLLEYRRLGEFNGENLYFK
jgi:glycerol-3-phosphate dehydrogenase